MVKNSVNRRLFTFYISNSRFGKCCQVLVTKTPNFAFAGSCTIADYDVVIDTVIALTVLLYF